MKLISRIPFNREIARKLLFTLFALTVFRALSNIPIPGLDMSVYNSVLANSSTSDANFLLTLVLGGSLESPSIVGLGIGVYITASIVVQLLTSIVPKLEELSKDGTRGKYVLDRITRFLTLPLSLVYSFGYLILLQQQGQGQLPLIPATATANTLLFMTIILTAGSMFIMWLAELVSEKGIANGASLMIMFGILAGLPTYIQIDVSNMAPVYAIREALNGNPQALLDPKFLSLIFVAIAMFLLASLIIFVTESVRKIVVQYARRQRNGVVQESFLPLKLNQNGVMPIIFASALLTMPQLIVPLISSVAVPESPLSEFMISVQESFLFNPQSSGYIITYFLLILLFSIFYIFISFKPEQVAENMQKNGSFVPGIRPGKSTENYLIRVLIRLNVVGAIFLAFIALIPTFGNLLILNYAQINLQLLSVIGGTSILIVIGVVLEAGRQIGALRATQNYDKYVY